MIVSRGLRHVQKAIVAQAGALRVNVAQQRAYALDPEKMDWANVSQIPVEDLPDMPSDEEWAKAQKFLNDVESGQVDIDPLSGVDIDVEVPDGSMPHEQILATPVKKAEHTDFQKVQLQRHLDILEVQF